MTDEYDKDYSWARCQIWIMEQRGASIEDFQKELAHYKELLNDEELMSICFFRRYKNKYKYLVELLNDEIDSWSV